MFFRACVLRVRLQPEAQPSHRRASGPCRDSRHRPSSLSVMDQVQEGLQVGRGPPAVQIGVAKAQIALADQPGEECRGCGSCISATGPGPVPFDAEPAAIGQHEIQPPLVQAARPPRKRSQSSAAGRSGPAWSSMRSCPPRGSFLVRHAGKYVPHAQEFRAAYAARARARPSASDNDRRRIGRARVQRPGPRHRVEVGQRLGRRGRARRSAMKRRR